ncbi:MAG: FimV family protein [Methylococcales symbiont of Iophon sp. n. MRB-2018]|nr:MAG: FimV family protein [Methylococcales symbiont of Iophon sp. n. MRB-2018]KAF3979418.1 MAG: FimV family protein [Methylococcales symbiont of Iophon sp. n. MRB-2018]
MIALSKVATVVKKLKGSAMSNLTKGIAAISILASASAYSLGIGDIKLHSALNQNLNAEIALFVSADEDISDINIRLASPDKFDEAGIPWNYFLLKIKFDFVTKADGSTLVKLSSNEALREPFLNFLLEVSWAKGNLYREFTVIVDPPVAYTQPIIPVIKKVVIESKAEEAISVSETQKNSVEITKPIIQYGPTVAADTLWKVAEKSNSYGDISIKQMVLAIYEANPKAFYKKNVNALMADKTLDIPGKEIILSLSQKEALIEFKRQNNAWNAIVVEKAKKDPVRVEISNQLELEVPIQEEVTEVVVTALEAQKESTVEASPVKNEEILVAVKSTDENIALMIRLEKLEKDLLVMQKMLAMKDEQFAALQSQGKTQIAQIVKLEKEKKNNERVASQAKKKVEKAKAVVKSVEKKAKKEKLKSVIKPVTQFDTDFFSGSIFKVILGIAVLILGSLGWLWSRKRKVEIETDDTESMFATASEMSISDSKDDSSVSVLDDVSSYDAGTVDESSFLSEFTPGDFDAFDIEQNEVDPVLEADVYLTYGRYQQAEDLMRQAIIDQPERDEYKLKLLEIFYENENKSSFEEYATELVNSGKHNDLGFWSKVVEMGREIALDSSLFTDQLNDSENFEITEKSEEAEPVTNEEGIATPVSNNDIDDDSAAEAVDFDLSVFDKSGSDEKIDEYTTVSDLDLAVFDAEDLGVKISTDEGLESVDFYAGVEEIVETEVAPSSSDGLDSLDMEVSDLTDMDELETKIDLARAYIDMGDVDAAKGIVDEVMDKGNDEQKAVAQAIIDQLK